ncbi:MAG TPA: hypothetical protein VGQ46_04125 [Thermoanaerobaculia bacterium]|jgi:hypothetical protein|nr:hypothetical protein [Thermoanaerobaculia bacterium]
MKTHKVKVVVVKDGRIILDDLPVVEGDEVEIAIEILDRSPVTYAAARRSIPLRQSIRSGRRSIGVGCGEVIGTQSSLSPDGDS